MRAVFGGLIKDLKDGVQATTVAIDLVLAGAKLSDDVSTEFEITIVFEISAKGSPRLRRRAALLYCPDESLAQIRGGVGLRVNLMAVPLVEGAVDDGVDVLDLLAAWLRLARF